MAAGWAAGRGPHPAPHESEWIVEQVTSSCWEVWFCNLCHKEVTSENGHIGSKGHEKQVHWATQGRRHAPPPPTQAAPRGFAPEAPASKAASAATAGAWLSSAEAPASQTSGAAAAASASASASSPVVVDAAAAPAPATAQGGTILIELPVAVAFERCPRACIGRASAMRLRQIETRELPAWALGAPGDRQDLRPSTCCKMVYTYRMGYIAYGTCPLFHHALPENFCKHFSPTLFHRRSMFQLSATLS